MGCGCKRGERIYSHAQLHGHEELEDHDFEKEKDSLVHFEKKFPLYKIHVNAWQTKLHQTGNHYLTIDNLKSLFRSKSFEGKFEKGTPLH